ncbi:MAG: carboxypeptidase-like regulatory domain-containing protein [Nibricoccus sp.]
MRHGHRCLISRSSCCDVLHPDQRTPHAIIPKPGRHTPNPKQNELSHTGPTRTSADVSSCFGAPAGETSCHTATPAATSGVVTGRVMNAATQNYLSNVEVRHTGSGAVTYTNPEGYFSLSIPTGGQSLTISYSGLETLEKSIVVQSGQNSLGDISLTRSEYEETIMLGEFVVATEREGRAASITQQRRAENIVNVVSSDEFPNVTSGNIGDFLRKSPRHCGRLLRRRSTFGARPRHGSQHGVSDHGWHARRQRSLIEHQPHLRNRPGLPAKHRVHRSHQISHGRTGSRPGRRQRQPRQQKRLQDQGPSHLLRRAGQHQLAGLHLGQEFYPDITDKRMVRPGGSISYSESFKNRLGVSVNVSSYEFFVINQSTQLNFNPATNYPTRKLTDPNGVYVGEYVNMISPVLTSRQSLGVNLDFRLSDSTTLWFKGQVNQSYLMAGGRGISMNAPNPRLVPATTNETINFNENHQEVIGDNPATYNPVTSTSGVHARVFTGEDLRKPGTGTVFSLGADQRFGLWTFNYAGSISQSTNHYELKRDVGGVNFYLRGIGFNLDTESGSPYTKLTQTAGPSIWDLSSYVSRNQTTINQTQGANEPKGTFTVLKQRDATGMDKFYTAKADARRDFETPYLKYIKTGVNFRQQERDTTKVGRQRWGYVGPDGIAYNADDTAIDYDMSRRRTFRKTSSAPRPPQSPISKRWRRTSNHIATNSVRTSAIASKRNSTPASPSRRSVCGLCDGERLARQLQPPKRYPLRTHRRRGHRRRHTA